ncbi:hypothetical protein PCANB_001635 [Pneumocystis canis]|nr:hypothetical protein PCANB_001635 [Pneumocystis canis]
MNAKKHNLNNCVVLKSGNNRNLTPNKHIFNKNSQSPNVESIVEMKSHSSGKKNKTSRKQFSTPHKQSDHYAGPTFHHSPAASNLPIPTFLSKSAPDIIQSQCDLYSEQSELHSQPSTSHVFPITSLHQPFNSPHSSSTSQTYLPTSPHEQVISDISYHSSPVDSSHEVHSLLELISQEDKNRRKQKHTLLKYETSVPSGFNNILYLKTYLFSTERVDRKKGSENGTFQSIHLSNSANVSQKPKDNQQNFFFSKKNRTQRLRNIDNDDYNNIKGEMKNKLLSLLLPSSPKSNKPISTNFPKLKKKQNLL